MSLKAARGFDPDSGQVYTETTCKADPITSSWVWKSRGACDQFINFIHDGPGCPSLRAISIRRYLSNVWNITTSTVEALPVHLASQLWDEIEKSHLDSLRLWKIFVSAFGHQLGKSVRYKKVTIYRPSSDLSEYTGHVLSPRFEWVTFVKLVNVPFSKTDMIRLARLTNLGKLALGPFQDRYVCLDDSLVRAWSRAASEAKAFTKLRILVCGSRVDITEKTFAYFQNLPALGLLLLEDFFDCPSALKSSAAKHHWRFIEECDVLRSVLATESSPWQRLYNTCFQDGVFDPDKVSRLPEEASGGDLVLDLALGNPMDPSSLRRLYLEKLQFFYRAQRCAGDRSPNIAYLGKRFLNDHATAEASNPKKRIIRASKRQMTDDLLAKLGN